MRRTLFALVLALGLAGCETFEPPPKPSIAGDVNGVMKTELDAPLVVDFSEPIVKSSLRIKVVKAQLDAEGNLLDEETPPKLDEFKASTLIAYQAAHPDDADLSYGGSFELTDTSLTITPDKPFAVSVPYLLLVEPGLEDAAGHATVPRIRLPFTFQLEGGGPTLLPTGYYYFLMNVDYLSTQIQAYTYMKVDPETGAWRAIFTNANRRPALNSRPGCPSSCPTDTPICALLPSPRCVKPSEKQTDLVQFTDFLPEPDPPNGYTFVADGFARDEADGTTAFGTAPFLIEVTIGTGGIKVDAENTRVAGIFRKHEDGRWRGTGSLSVETVKLNNVGADPTKGTFDAMSLTADEVKAVESFGYPIPTDLGQ